MTAIMAGTSCMLYLAITYLSDYPTIMDKWFDKLDRIFAVQLLVLYSFTLYVKQHRFTFLYSLESVVSLIIITPVLSMEDMSMKSQFYVFLSFSRYVRVIYLFEILRKYNKFGETDVDRHINKIGQTMCSIIFVSACIFAEIENSTNLEKIDFDIVNPVDETGAAIDTRKLNWPTGMIFKCDGGCFKFLYFHDALYFVVVTLITVGYGDINPTEELGKVWAICILLICIIIIPPQTTELSRQFSL